MRTAQVATAAALLSACTAFKPLPPPESPTALGMQLREGDRVRVLTRDGKRLSFRITEVGAAAVTGTSNGALVQLDYEQLAFVEVSRIDGGKTSKNILLGSLATLGALLLVVMATC